jgi:ribose transport system substrate-binding protein
VLADGSYQGIITQPVDSTNLIPLVQLAVAKQISVVNIDRIMGPSLSTYAVQVKGLSGSVTSVPSTIGKDLGTLTIQACRKGHFNPCNVAYLYGIQGSAVDTAIKRSFSVAIKSSPVRVVAVGEDNYSSAGGLSAAQSVLGANPNINVIAGCDQGIEGAAEATAGKNILLVGYGGSAAGIRAVRSGQWFGTIVQDPATEGKEGIDMLINAIRTGTNAAGVNPLTTEPNAGVITKTNARLFTGEWPG